MNDFIRESGFESDVGDERSRREIYLSDVRKTAPEKWKTVVRLPIKPRR